MEVRIQIDRVKPLEGTIADRSGSDAIPFCGWLELLRLLDDFLSPQAGVTMETPVTDDS